MHITNWKYTQQYNIIFNNKRYFQRFSVGFCRGFLQGVFSAHPRIPVRENFWWVDPHASKSVRHRIFWKFADDGRKGYLMNKFLVVRRVYGEQRKKTEKKRRTSHPPRGEFSVFFSAFFSAHRRVYIQLKILFFK